MGGVGGVCVNVGVMLTFIMACSDTVTRSGMFCAMATVIDRCKTEGVVDVFQVVKALRAQKPGAVPTVVILSKNLHNSSCSYFVSQL